MFIPVGYGGFVSVLEISAIGPSDSAPMKKLRKEAKDKGLLVDFTKGHPTRSILFLKDHRVVLSSFQPETLVSRVNRLLAKIWKGNNEIHFMEDVPVLKKSKN